MQRFSDFAAAQGLLIGDLYASDRIRRCGTVEHPRKKNGSYFWDGRRGWVLAWDGEGEVRWYNDPDAKPWTEAEKREFARKRASERARLVERQRQAARRAEELVLSAVPGKHGYLDRKGLHGCSGLVLSDESLIVPMRNLATNALQGAQVIRWLPDERVWDKRMLPGTIAKGAVFHIGPPRPSETILCEGYATGLSIDAAARQMRIHAAVLVCFSAGNLTHVAPMVKGRKYAFADNDVSGTGERSAKEAGLAYCMSDVVGEDANDLHGRAGLMAVCQKLMGVRRMLT